MDKLEQVLGMLKKISFQPHRSAMSEQWTVNSEQ